LGKRSYAY